MRLHCTWKSEDGALTVTEQKGVTGLWVNGVRLPSEEPHTLKVGDALKLEDPTMWTEVELQSRMRRTLRVGCRVTHAPQVHKRKLPVVEVEVATSKPKLHRRSIKGEVVDRPRVPEDQSDSQRCHGRTKEAGRTRRQEEQKTQQQEELLKKQLEEALQEQRKVIDELAHSRQGFEEILSAKNKELELTKEKARAQKEEVVMRMNEVLENELQCIICSEFLIEAVTLNCAHSFCSHCISQWREMKDECPICRRAIVSQTRCLALDNCVKNMVDKLSLEMKSRRQTLVTERKRERMSWSCVKRKLQQWWSWSF